MCEIKFCCFCSAVPNSLESVSHLETFWYAMRSISREALLRCLHLEHEGASIMNAWRSYFLVAKAGQGDRAARGDFSKAPGSPEVASSCSATAVALT